MQLVQKFSVPQGRVQCIVMLFINAGDYIPHLDFEALHRINANKSTVSRVILTTPNENDLISCSWRG